ncbi:hypothetical protein E5P55_00650 [Candidatus Pinguicoccus supinus]|uniref:Dehydrogenase E1 component domain-containing protein n=1 Tax=Candidatus Pinguicoccus supinus TaxID=2529394 RepID=A0A7T0BRV3_9BACT|nr:hypothetical protein E5P55_00650 [Candidatus Pinguicoccus supinus]
MGTLQINSCVNKILSKRAKEFKMQWGFLKEGFDLFKVRDITFKFIYNIRLGLPAGVLEVHTYRYKGHSMSDPDKTYRSKIEVNLYKNNYDPISFYKNYLLNKNIFSSTTLENCLLNIKNIILNSSTTADLSSYPNVRSIFDDIY